MLSFWKLKKKDWNVEPAAGIALNDYQRKGNLIPDISLSQFQIYRAKQKGNRQYLWTYIIIGGMMRVLFS